MKKNQHKNNKSGKTKIELKIKSKNVTNNFILTPRNQSPRETAHKNDRYLEECKTDRFKYDQHPKSGRESRGTEHRRVTTDSNKFNLKKRFEEDQTGTHTPLVKRISVTHQSFNKKKSCHSLIASEKVKNRKKTSEKLSKNTSGELNTAMFQRVLGIIIKDYKEGRLKEKQLEKTLLELYDRKDRKKSIGKKKKKSQAYQTFSNQFLRSMHQNHTKSQTMMKKRKISSEDEEVEERVLQRQGFVNKIIVKGITTSMFLKEDPSVSQLKQSQGRNLNRQPSLHIHTSNSMQQINEEMRMIEEHYNNLVERSCERSALFTFEDEMAAKIQRAWRRYRTKKLFRNIAFCTSNQNAINIIEDEFTDEEGKEYVNSPEDSPNQKEKQKQKSSQQSSPAHSQSRIQADQYSELTQLVINSLNEKKMSKEECLKRILSYLNIPVEQIPVPQHPEIIEEEEDIFQQKDLIFNEEELGERQGASEEMALSRVKIFPGCNDEKLGEENIESPLSNELNSFTNKYSSKDVLDNTQFYKGNSVIEQAEEMDKSLTFVHSQTSASQTFKMVNIQNIQEGLRSRQQSLMVKKQKQVEDLTERFFNGKVNKQQYLSEKAKIDKWFKYQSKELKKVKNSLLKSCCDAQKILDSQVVKLNTQKSQKMMKCLSDKYLKKGNWSLNNTQGAEKKRVKRVKKMKCQEEQDEKVEDIRMTQLGFKIGMEQDDPSENSQQFMIFNKKESFDQDGDDEEEDYKQFQISPKMQRKTKEDDDINEYKYEQIQKIIQQDEDGLDEGLVPIENMVHTVSDRFPPAVDEESSVEQHEITLINKLVNENNKFKYLCNEDKEDIFQFLFLDLVLEMFTEGQTGQSRILRSAQVHINKTKRLKRISKGIKTNIAASKEYLVILSKYVVNLNNGLRNLSFPMGPSAIQMLRYMRDEIVEAEDEQAISSTLVLPIDIFEKVSRLPELQLKVQRYYEQDEKEINRLSFLRTAMNINNKSLFDCLNEMLDHERPYGVWGKPFPWKKTLALDKKWKKNEEEKKLRKCLDKTVQSCSYLCGILVDKEDSLFGSHRVSEEYVMQIREDRLSKMLANELLQNEERWIFYDDEQTEILMQVSSFLTKKLIKEVVLEMASIGMKF